MGPGAAMGSTPRRGLGATAPGRRRSTILLGRVAAAVHAGAVGAVVARLALAILARAPVGGATYAAGCRADGRAGAGRARRGADRRTKRGTTERADGCADAHALGGVRRRVPARLL